MVSTTAFSKEAVDFLDEDDSGSDASREVEDGMYELVALAVPFIPQG